MQWEHRRKEHRHTHRGKSLCGWAFLWISVVWNPCHESFPGLGLASLHQVPFITSSNCLKKLRTKITAFQLMSALPADSKTAVSHLRAILTRQVPILQRITGAARGAWLFFLKRHSRRGAVAAPSSKAFHLFWVVLLLVWGPVGFKKWINKMNFTYWLQSLDIGSFVIKCLLHYSWRIK